MSDIKQILILKEIDQLDSAILQFSKNTLATKKICASLLAGIAALILKLTDNHLDISIFISSFTTLLIFWTIDSNSYYYQRKLRIRMTEIVNELKENQLVTNGYGMPLGNKDKSSRVRSFFNESQLFYLLGASIMIILIFIDLAGWIK
ncbi:hypothetical protein SYJ56_22430 [Algoriphagus sp. D3-2-R+10]|uniref:hypothetical protein n=1 Tax=Algoriphagus aurantiacus TaxID=3103948 RepID=UPI002B3D42F5|nr:hypothetical protein [Algoriphagus sp. D3-2-R+10]MEB2778087.1 hypothetical protein [Algoriphagus sp. D3-2-R+10]